MPSGQKPCHLSLSLSSRTPPKSRQRSGTSALLLCEWPPRLHRDNLVSRHHSYLDITGISKTRGGSKIAQIEASRRHHLDPLKCFGQKTETLTDLNVYGVLSEANCCADSTSTSDAVGGVRERAIIDSAGNAAAGLAAGVTDKLGSVHARTKPATPSAPSQINVCAPQPRLRAHDCMDCWCVQRLRCRLGAKPHLCFRRMHWQYTAYGYFAYYKCAENMRVLVTQGHVPFAEPVLESCERAAFAFLSHAVSLKVGVASSGLSCIYTKKNGRICNATLPEPRFHAHTQAFAQSQGMRVCPTVCDSVEKSLTD